MSHTIKERNVTEGTCDEFNLRHPVCAVAGGNPHGNVEQEAKV